MNQQKTKIKLLIPEVAKYDLLYEKADGQREKYVISPPIEKAENSFTAYAFGKGIRTFVNDRVLNIDLTSRK